MLNDKKRKGNILTENLIFIILNLVFLIILVVFLVSRTGGAAVLEEKYAKQIALAIDSAKPGMEIQINMEDAIIKAEKEGADIRGIVSVENNVVIVKLRERGGYSYSFFNSVSAPTSITEDGKGYFFTIEEK